MHTMSCPQYSNSTATNCSTSLVDELCSIYNYKEWMLISYTVIDILFFLIIVGGNTMVIIAYHTSRRLKTVTNYFIVQLAYADLVVGLARPFHIVTFLCQNILKDFRVCVFKYALSVTSVSESTMMLLLMTIDRYIAIVQPFKHDTLMSTKRARIGVVITWVIAITGGLITPMLWNNQSKNINGFHDCNFSTIFKHEYFAYFLLPTVSSLIVIIVILYALLYRVAKEKLNEMQYSNPRHARCFNGDVRTSKTIGIVLGFFLFCWVPFLVLIAWEVYSPDETGRKNEIINKVRAYLSLFVVLNSGLNPFIYSFRMKDFKYEFKKIMHCKEHSNSDIFRMNDSYRMTSYGSNCEKM